MANHPASSASILLVEDDDFVRDVIVEILRSAGFDVLPAQNAEKAMEVAGTCGDKIDLLLSDVVMPGRTGPELGLELRKNRPSIKLLFTSGYGDSVPEMYGSDMSGAFYLPKPFSVGALVGKVREALDSEARCAGASASG